MTEPSKHKHAAEPPTRSSGSRRAEQPPSAGTRFAWLRTTRGQVAVVVAVLAVAVLARVLASGGGDDAAARKAAQDALPGGYGTTWTAKDGSSYRLTMTPVPKAVLDASASQCVSTPAGGRANVRFQVRIDNLSAKTVPVPRVEFGATVTRSGAISKDTTFASLSKQIDLGQAGVQGCAQASKLGPTSGEPIAESGSVQFSGLIGGLRAPVADGLLLIARYDAGSATAVFGSFAR